MSNDPILHLLGLAKKAGRLEVGEEPVGAACRARQARLILLASDAAPNTRRRAAHFGEAGGILWLEIPFDKGELGSVLGRASCAMLAFTDAGFAASACAKLAARDPDRYGPAALQLRTKADRLLQRQREQRQHEKNVRKGKRSWAPPSKGGPPSPGEKAAAPKEGGPRPPKAARRPKAGPARRPETGPGPIQTPAKGGPGRRRLTGTFRKP